jgi:hypothetical protein
MSEEKSKRKNDADVVLQEWMGWEKTARRWLAAWFVLVSLFFCFLVNPLQFASRDSGFLALYLLIAAIPAIGGIAFAILSNNEEWTRKQVMTLIEKPNKINEYAGMMFIGLAILQFIIGKGEQKFLLAPCFVAIGIYWHLRYQKYKHYVALTGEEKAK